ncbi:inositol monophosphatase [Gammaproteobacteria bacterium]|nr:inositol monophosphatase [Gammaproteobacteria bacterium]
MEFNDINKELVIAKKAIFEAGNLLLKKNEILSEVILSTNKDIKLKADILAEKAIKDIIENESDYPILAEESGLSSKDIPNIFWVVDPLDGTANYARNIPICCVSIALVLNLKPILGVIFDFINNDLYEGSIYTKALLNNEEMSVSKVTSSSEGILITGLPNNTDYSDNALLKMVKDFQQWRKVRMIGSAAMASVYVASGKADLYTEKKTYLWDIAAGAAIVNAAGGKAEITNFTDNYQVDAHFSNSKITD